MKTLAQETPAAFWPQFYGALRRVFPNCVTLTQAVAFNMFLAFSPMILVILGAVAGSAAFRQTLESVIARLRIVFPPGMLTVLTNFVGKHPREPWELVLLGLGGTLLAATAAAMARAFAGSIALVREREFTRAGSRSGRAGGAAR